jgi:uncharacterized membrane protein
MNEAEISAVVLGVTELVKKYGLPSKFCPLVALFLSVGISITEMLNSGEIDYYSTIMRGILVGVATTGSYAAVDRLVTKSTPNENHSQETY